ncbi:MAG: hypothetical protein EOM15_12075 [Spirochaetia bacterium]|nr:hypothetical protein [Spirochaetia bacterium]
MIEAPQRFNENPEKATEIKKNSTEYFGIDQDGVAKSVTAEILLTKANVGLSNVPNVSTNNQTPTYTTAAELAALTSGETLTLAFGKIAKSVLKTIQFLGNLSNYGGLSIASDGSIDDILMSGLYTGASGATGSPEVSDLYLIHINSNTGSTAAWQIAIAIDTGKIYLRTKASSSWGAWNAGITATELGYISGATSNLQDQITEVKGSGWTDENLVDHEERLDTLEGDDATEGSVAKTVKDAVEPIKGSGWTDETVKGNAEAIAGKENLANKKSTLVENSEIYYPNQKAVNDGLNLTMAEMMGFAPRNLMDVFGTSTVADTFEAVRASVIGGDFSKLRLGDYIDLDTFTVLNWHNGVHYSTPPTELNPSTWDTNVTVEKNSNLNTRVEIVGFDDYYYIGNTAYPTAHHVTFMFQNIPLVAPFNVVNPPTGTSPWSTTVGGYAGSELKAHLGNIYTALASQFGSATPLAVDRYVATHNSSQWCGSEQIFLPTNQNIFGDTGFAHANRGVGTQRQFALFSLNPSKIMKRRNGSSPRQTWWLAEPSEGSSTNFTFVSGFGHPYYYYSSYALGVVPAFLI